MSTQRINHQKLPVTVCLPVKNEEEKLAACLEALGKDFTEVVVVDSGSTDRTCEIARQAGATVLNFSWDGGFPKKRNWFLRNHHFKTDWVLFLDADELMTQEFLAELRSILPGSQYSGYWICFTNWFMGAPLLHGDVFRKLALFRHEQGEYERFPESCWSHLDMEVHEHPVLTGVIGEVAARLNHYPYRSLEHYRAKHDEYSTWEANRFLWLQSAGSESWDQLNKRQQFKYRYLDRWWLGWVYFIGSYLARKGFLDGRAAFTFAHLKLRYFRDIRFKIEIEKSDRR